MKLNHIRIDNVLGIRHIDAPLPTSVNIFSGPNHSGKTSIQNCIHYALTGQLPRVSQKKEIKALIHEGQKAGKIRIHTDISTKPRDVVLPSGTISGPSSTHVALPYLLDPTLFVALKPNDRRTFLFELFGIKASMTEIQERLKTLGCDMALVELILPTLKKGYAAAKTEAAENATKSKGAWGFIAGERWGSDKAESWFCPMPECKIEGDEIEEKKSKLVELKNELSAFHKTTGELSEKNIAYNKETKLIIDLKFKAKEHTELSVKADEIFSQLQEQKTEVAQLKNIIDSPQQQPCPHCGLFIIIVDGEIKPIDSIAATEGTIDKFDLAMADLAQLEHIYSQAKQKFDAADNAYNRLQDRPEIEKPEPYDLDRFDAQTNDLESKIKTLNEDLGEFSMYQASVESAKQKNEQAEQEHKNVLAWLEMAAAFSPDGIPSELLSEALSPINDRLLSHAKTTGWLHARITPNVEIEANGRPYNLLSESEQWRVNAMIVEAISYFSGLKIFCLDRIDVLDLHSRTDLIKWLLYLAKCGDIDTCILSGTLKSLPKISGVTSYWIENGIIESNGEE